MVVKKILVTDHPWLDLDVERSILEPLNIEIVDAPDGDEETLCRLSGGVFAIAACWAKVTEKVIRQATRCKIICRMGIGLDNIDIETATELGIPVTNVPDYCIEEVADHAVGLVLALARNIGFYHLRTKHSEYDLSAGPPMHRLRGRRLGLIGFGRIGREVYQRAIAFGLDVVACTPSRNSHGTDCEMVSLEELIATSDIISLHAPLTEQTRHLIDESSIQKMKPGVVVVNTSRGPLIDPDALKRGLEQGIIAGAGLDVFEPEPPDLSCSLYQSERVIVTPHAAFVSEESLIDLRTSTANQIAAMLNQEVPGNVVNPAVLSSARR